MELTIKYNQTELSSSIVNPCITSIYISLYLEVPNMASLT